MSAPFQTFILINYASRQKPSPNKEIGLKRYFLDDALSLRAAFFHTARNQAQLESWMWDATAGLWIGYLDSTSDANNYGAEFEGNFQAIRDLNFFFSLGLLETEIDSLRVFDLDANSFVARNNREQAKAI